MTATERLRALLDERGVEWWPEDDQEEPAYYFITKWFANGCEQAYEEIPAIRSRSLKAYCLTPEQAIAATLGAGTCKPREVRSRFSKTQEYVTYHCECGHELCGYMTAEIPFPHTYNEDELPNYCPNCGRRIVQEDE